MHTSLCLSVSVYGDRERQTESLWPVRSNFGTAAHVLGCERYFHLAGPPRKNMHIYIYLCCLRHMNVQKIAGVASCTNLVQLDLSNNAIVTISGLSALAALSKLVLASNRITSVGGLEGLCSLKHLLLQDNKIGQTDSINLPMLAQLPSLQSLYLSNPGGRQVRWRSRSNTAISGRGTVSCQGAK